MRSKERFLPVKGYKGKYEVSNYGKVRSLPMHGNFYRGKLLKGEIDQDGYVRYTLYKNNKSKHRFGHQLVLSAFSTNPKRLPEINHKNGVKKDNYCKNLEYCTRSHNRVHALAMGLAVGMKGTANGMCKLSEKTALSIFKSPQGVCSLAKKYNIPISTVGNIKSGHHWSWLTGKKYNPKPMKTIQPKDVISIFKSDLSASKIAIKYGISGSAVWKIKHKMIHRNVLNKVR